MSKKIGIIGGTFDPPHLGHLIIANETLHALELDEMWFMPNNLPPHKKRNSNSTNTDRVNMLEMAIEGIDQFRIEKIELERKGKSYTFDTINLLNEKYKDHKFFFLIGADMIEYLPNWYKVNELIKLVQFVGVGRVGYKYETNYPIIHIDIPLISISSSMIRKRIKEKKTIQYLVPNHVKRYIEENDLYGS